MELLWKLQELALDLDIYGHKIELHFKGKSSYKTWLGLFCTLLVYGIVFQSMVVLGSDFVNFSRQDEKISIYKFDRHNSEKYNLVDNGIKFYLLSYKQ